MTLKLSLPAVCRSLLFRIPGNPGVAVWDLALPCSRWWGRPHHSPSCAALLLTLFSTNLAGILAPGCKSQLLRGGRGHPVQKLGQCHLLSLGGGDGEDRNCKWHRNFSNFCHQPLPCNGDIFISDTDIKGCCMVELINTAWKMWKLGIFFVPV